MKKIVMLTSSPRQNSNTDAMAAAFEAAIYVKALATGQKVEVKKYDTTKLNVKWCMGCDCCFSQGKPCIIDDDFNAIAEEIMAADGIVYVAPVYWYTYPASLKAVIDRMYCMFMGLEGRFKGKKAALLSCCGDERMSVFDGITTAFESGMHIMGADIVGEVLVPGIYETGRMKETDGIDRAAKLALEFI